MLRSAWRGRGKFTSTTLHTTTARCHGLSGDESGAGELESWRKLPDIVRLPVSVPTIREADWKQAWAVGTGRGGVFEMGKKGEMWGLGQTLSKGSPSDDSVEHRFMFLSQWAGLMISKGKSVYIFRLLDFAYKWNHPLKIYRFLLMNMDKHRTITLTQWGHVGKALDRFLWKSGEEKSWPRSLVNIQRGRSRCAAERLPG